MIQKEIILLRKELHKHPELSGYEYKTAQRIINFIEKNNPTDIIKNIGGTGIAAIYEFSKEGPTIAIRCELDALPINEENQFAHRSVNDKVSHKCGHDGHMAIVAGLSLWLKEQSFNSGKIILLFQPSEENGKGAERVINDPKFQKLKVDYIFALHNIPQEAMHTVITMDTGFSAEVESCIISLEGKESHTAEPENGINPSQGIAEIINRLSALNNSNPRDNDFAVLTPVHVTMGNPSYGISPSSGELHYTMRTWNSEKLQILKSKIENITSEVSTVQKLDYNIKWLEYFPASRNNRECNKFVTQAADKNKFQISERPYPFKFGEDFGWFTKEYKTAMFGIGAGLNTPPLHNASYDFPDEIIDMGINMFKEVIKIILK